MGRGLTEMLLGSDPLDVEGIWERLYVGSAMNGRRGVVVNAIGAIDMALHDLRGKALGRPCHELLGGAVKDAVTPYASLQPEVSSFEAYRDSLVVWAIDAKNRGFTAVKAEVILRGPYAHKGLLCPDHRATGVVAAVRDALGEEFTLMVDVGYAWDNAEVALATLRLGYLMDLQTPRVSIIDSDVSGYSGRESQRSTRKWARHIEIRQCAVSSSQY